MSNTKNINSFVTDATQSKQKTEKKSARILGIVENCGRLRIREKPYNEANVIDTIPVGTKIELYDDKLTNGFYTIHIETEKGKDIVGYCMKEFIGIVNSIKEQ